MNEQRELKSHLLAKSPANVAVGELVRGHRIRAGLDTHTVADAFGLSAAYVRAIEAGQRALPAYAVAGLVEQFGMPWLSASSLVAIAGFLDLARDDNEYVVDTLLELSRRLRGQVPEYRDFLNELEEIVTANIRPSPKGAKAQEPAPGEWTRRTRLLSQTLERSLNGKNTHHPVRRGIRTSDSLNPVFEDLVENLASQLAMFPPHVNASSVQQFEQTNAGRIRRLLGFVSDPETLTGSSAEDWQVVRGPLSPTVQVLLPNMPLNDVRDVADKFKKALSKAGPANRRTQSELGNRVHLKSADDLHKDCVRALLFDFTTRSRATAGSDLSDAIRRFPNAWLYELQPESIDHHVPRWVGFLMDRDPVHGYAVAMKGDHVQEWLEIFAKAFTSDSPKQSGRLRRRPIGRSRR